jgi:hypothetical protein
MPFSTGQLLDPDPALLQTFKHPLRNPTAVKELAAMKHGAITKQSDHAGLWEQPMTIEPCNSLQTTARIAN